MVLLAEQAEDWGTHPPKLEIGQKGVVGGSGRGGIRFKMDCEVAFPPAALRKRRYWIPEAHRSLRYKDRGLRTCDAISGTDAGSAATRREICC
eukprot:2371016-Rhodomonas_salina.2